jgi:uncharacterized damage-inducible protein DinB
MKTHFTKLFNYDKHANLLIVDTIIKAGNPESAVKLMAHMLAAQQVWIKRCKGEPTIGGALWPDWQANTFNAIINDNNQQWIDFIDSLTDTDFSRMVSYQNSKGLSFNNELSDVLAHIINHGTHHRAQAGQQLKFAGIEKLPLTDYIFYIRDL